MYSNSKLKQIAIMLLIASFIVLSVSEKDYKAYLKNFERNIVIDIAEQKVVEVDKKLLVLKSALPNGIKEFNESETILYNNLYYVDINDLAKQYTLMPVKDGYRSLIEGVEKDKEFYRKEKEMEQTKIALIGMSVLAILVLFFL